MRAVIYQPAKTAMQSGRANSRRWLLEFEPGAARTLDPLMGWTSSRDTSQQVRLAFTTREAAVAYAERNGVDYRVIEPQRAKPRLKAYADNFRYDRVE